ncbi:3370_t:CDS:2, partial [Racocetra fulgida]
MESKKDIINQSNTNDIVQLPTIIPDYIVINLPGMDYPVLIYPSSVEEKHFDISSICPKELSHQSRDHVPSETVKEVQSNISNPDLFLGETSSTFEINSKVQSTTTCFPNEQLFNIQDSSFDVNLPPHGCYHVNEVNGFNNNSTVVENSSNDMFQLSETEIVSSSELDLTPDGLMVKLPAKSNKQLKGHSKTPVPIIDTKNIPTNFVEEEEYADEEESELLRSSLSSPHSTISSTSFSMSVLSTTSTYAESMNTIISTSSLQTIDKAIISSSTYSTPSSFNQSPEFKANSINDDHIDDQYIDEIPYKQENGKPYYISERSISPEHLSPVIEEDETLIAIQNSQISDCSTLNEYDIKQLSESEDQHIESHVQDDSDFEQSCDEYVIKSNLNSDEIHSEADHCPDLYPEHCPELDAIDDYLQTLNLEKNEEKYEAMRLRHQLKIIREAPYP